MSLVSASRLIGNFSKNAFQLHKIAKKNTIKQFNYLNTIRFTHTLRFTDKHEWIRVEDNVGTIGITDHAQVIIN